MKIHNLKKYKFDGKSFVKDRFSLRRFSILLLLGLTLLSCYWVNHLEDYVKFKDNDVIALEHKPKIQLALSLYIQKSNPKVTDDDADSIASSIIEYSDDPFLIAGLMKVESNFEQYAISGSNAMGFTQVIPTWHKEKIRELKKRFGHFDVFDHRQNIALGVMVYEEYLTQLGSVSKALTQYNGNQIDIPYAKMVLAEKRKAEKYYN
jgi:hypothetical protein